MIYSEGRIFPSGWLRETIYSNNIPVQYDMFGLLLETDKQNHFACK